MVSYRYILASKKMSIHDNKGQLCNILGIKEFKFLAIGAILQVMKVIQFFRVLEVYDCIR